MFSFYGLISCFPEDPEGWLQGAVQLGMGVMGAGAPAHAFAGVAAEPGTHASPLLTTHFLE